MPSDYDRIRDDNIRRRGEEFDDIGRFVAEQLYSDRTHFIYELLQNTEDAGATRVTFHLLPDRLEFRHYGGRPFNTRDVEGISDILRGAKQGDPMMIGKFGIGFKSVFAFTATPEIHSGDEHFRIERYIRPYVVEPIALERRETYMIFPFDHPKVSATETHGEIARRLATLGPRTLLFLHNVTALDYVVEGGLCGKYQRSGKKIGSPRPVTLRRETSGRDAPEVAESWLLFEDPVRRSDGTRTRPIHIAFRVTREGPQSRDQIVPIPNAPLSVSFPTAQTTDLGFLVDGPYVTTSARDNIKRDDAWNRGLVAQTAELVVHSLCWLRDQRLLSVSALEAMPIKSPESHLAYNQGFFRSIYDRVQAALQQEKLLPTGDGRFVSARDAKLSRGSELRALLSRAQLKLLFKSDHGLSWLSDDITEDRAPELRKYLRTALKVEEVTPEVFAGRFDEEFVQAQDDTWMVRFYKFLDDQKALWRRPRWEGDAGGPLRNKPFIRLQDDKHTAPFDANDTPKAYLPGATDTHFPTVKASIARDPGALGFLRKLGLTEPDLTDEAFEFILPKYHPLQEISAEENLDDIRAVLSALATAQGEKKTRLRERLKETKFLYARTLADDRERYRTPRETYLAAADLHDYFDGNADACFLAHQLSAEEEAALCALGVSRQVRIRRREAELGGHVVLQNERGCHRRGLSGFDPECEIDGLEHALRTITPKKAAYIWNELLAPNSAQIRGLVEFSGRKDYIDSTKEEQRSKLGELVTSMAWIPSRVGGFHRPSDLSPEDLPTEFSRDERLTKALGLKPPVAAEALRALGIDAEHAQFIRENPDSFRQWVEERRRAKSSQRHEDTGVDGARSELDYQSLLTEAFRRPPEGQGEPAPHGGSSVGNPDRYRERVTGDLEQAKQKEPLVETRFQRVPRKVWEAKDAEVRVFLREQYGGQCQICAATFPKRDRTPYFEGVYLVSRTGARWLDQPGNVLCLCPMCTAKFQYGSVEADNVPDQLLGMRTLREGGDGNPTIRIRLCDEEVTIRFTERHLLRLQALLEGSSA